MHVQVPQPLKSEIQRHAGPKAGFPGLLIATGPTSSLNPKLNRTFEDLRQRYGLAENACLVVPPEQLKELFAPDKDIFAYEKELDLLRTVVAELAGLAHPYAKHGVNGVWLVFGLASLANDWQKPERNTAACFFKLGGLALSASKLAGGVNPDLKLPDHWANGVNYLMASGKNIAEGKAPPSAFMTVASSQPLMSIPLKALKCMNISLEPGQQPSVSVLQSAARAGSPERVWQWQEAIARPTHPSAKRS